jgi:phospholipid transport system substrate-binding protein
MSSVYRIASRRLKAFGAGVRWLTYIASVLLVTTSMPESAHASAQPSPTEAMRTTVNQALGVLRDQELKKPERTEERGTQLKRIAGSRFDYGEMAKRSLGGQWDKLDERQRQEFVDLFTEFVTATYMEKIHAYSGEEVTFLNERLDGTYAEVKSIMVGKKTEIPISYRLLLKGDDWKAYDVIVDGISLVRNYREQFTTILRSSSYEHLLQILREKNTQYNVKTKNSESVTSSR